MLQSSFAARTIASTLAIRENNINQTVDQNNQEQVYYEDLVYKFGPRSNDLCEEAYIYMSNQKVESVVGCSAELIRRFLESRINIGEELEKTWARISYKPEWKVEEQLSGYLTRIESDMNKLGIDLSDMRKLDGSKTEKSDICH